MIPIYEPYLPEKSLKHAHEALGSTWISSQGKYVNQVQEKLQNTFGVKHAQLINNGTAATHLVAKALLRKHPNIKKLFVPNNVYVAAWNAFCYDNNIELVPIDADISTWNFDIEQLKNKIEENCAVLVVHNIGNIINVPRLKKELPASTIFVEDNCEGFMGTYEDKFSGTESLISSLSFFGNKTITCGEGGAILTNDTATYEYITKVKGQGQSDERYVHDVLGYNYRLTNIQAALLLGQLETLPEILVRKDEVFSLYRDAFAQLENVHVQEAPEGTNHSNWMMGIRIEGASCFAETSAFLKERGVDSRPMFYPMSAHKHLEHYANPKDEVVASQLSKECILLPSYPGLAKAQCMKVIESVQEFCVGDVPR